MTALDTLRTIYARAGFSVAPPVPGSAADQGYVLRDSVLANFAAWSSPLEGALLFLYTDVKGLVTTGIGNLVDPIDAARALPWVSPDGSPATDDEVIAAWHAVKSAWPSVQSVNCGKLTRIRLTEDGLTELVNRQLKVNDAFLAAHLPGYSLWPADAQLAANSMAWAMGPGWVNIFKNLVASLTRGDFASAALECGINSAGNPGVVPRNTADVLLFQNAAKVASGRGDAGTLYFLDPVPDSDAGPPDAA